MSATQLFAIPFCTVGTRTNFPESVKILTQASITSDGIVSTATWEQMRKDITPIQTTLGNKGYDIGVVDGIVTNKVYNAVLKYQSDNGLTADGMVNFCV